MFQKEFAEATTPEEREEAAENLREFVFEDAFEDDDVEGAAELQSMTAEELDPVSSIFLDPRMYAHAINTFHPEEEEEMDEEPEQDEE